MRAALSAPAEVSHRLEPEEAKLDEGEELADFMVDGFEA